MRSGSGEAGGRASRKYLTQLVFLARGSKNCACIKLLIAKEGNLPLPVESRGMYPIATKSAFRIAALFPRRIAMEASYLELKKEVEQMQTQLERARQAEIPKIVAAMRRQIEEYRIAPDELYPELSSAARVQNSAGRSSRTRRDRPAKYRSPEGETWSGGPGRKPMWVRKIEERGESIEQYRIPPQ